MYKFLDIFFVVFHTTLILFNLFGWIWKKTRLANFITLVLTAASWFILGIFYGIGYCPLTDWHFNILRKLGEHGLPGSYIKYLVDRLTGLDINSQLVDIATVAGLFLALALSVYTNFFFSKNKKRKKQ